MYDQVRALVEREACSGEDYLSVPLLVVVPMDEVLRYPGHKMEVTPPEPQSTHLVRFIVKADDAQHVHADEWWLEIGTDSVGLLSVPDAPAFTGTMEDARAWCTKLSR